MVQIDARIGKMTYSEAITYISINKPRGWHIGDKAEFQRDLAEARRLSDPRTWPENVKRDG